MVRAQPAFQQAQVFGIRLRIGNRNLVGTVRTLYRLLIHFFRTCPAFERAQKDHRPAWLGDWPTRTGRLLNSTDLLVGPIQGAIESSVQVITFHELYLVAISRK